jgi:hypothetical protein
MLRSGQKGASRSTHCLASALLSRRKSISLTASFAGKTMVICIPA